jgi:uncharacterized oxidoreductase
MKIQAERLRELVAAMFARAGCGKEEAQRVAFYLVEANLVGHDSHGVIRVPSYIGWLQEGKVLANQSIEVVLESDVLAIVDGRFGFGQTIGEQAVRLGIEKARKHGVSVVGLRNTGHLGRIGDWPLMAARENLLSLHFVNTSGAGMLVAPFGGISRRLSACPFAAGIPVAGGDPMIVDISMCTIAEGKIKVALNKGVSLPEGCIIDSHGQPTNDPRVFYADPPGSILSIAGHKGYALGMVTEILAGALTGGSCTNPAYAKRLTNSMLSIYLDYSRFAAEAEFEAEVRRFIDFVRSSEQLDPSRPILMPGEIEEQTKARRLADAIELDETTWSQICKTAESLGVPVAGSA